MSHHILPKSSRWSDRKRNYHQAYLAYRLSVKLLKPTDQPFSEKHWRLFHQLAFQCDVVLYKNLLQSIWSTAMQRGSCHVSQKAQ